MKKPEFQNPPLIEISLSIQFPPLNKFKTPHFGLLWKKYAENFPKFQEQRPLNRIEENFGSKGPRKIKFSLHKTPPAPRLWFLSEDETELVQVQQDRFVRNWRKRSDEDVYPEYETIKEKFVKDFQTFRQFIEEESLGEIKPDHCELVYVDHIPVGELPESQGSLGEVLTFCSPGYEDQGLGKPEQASCKLQFLLEEDETPYGRIYVEASPARQISPQQDIFLLKTIGRTKLRNQTVDEVFKDLDTLHDKIISLFLNITREKMHKKWKGI